jgi:hypothetical protein
MTMVARQMSRSYADALTDAGFDLISDVMSGSSNEATLAAHKAIVWFTGMPIVTY